MEKVRIKNKRLSKYLYSLGFDREYRNDGDREIWLFVKSDALKKALDFYFEMRQINRD